MALAEYAIKINIYMKGETYITLALAEYAIRINRYMKRKAYITLHVVLYGKQSYLW